MLVQVTHVVQLQVVTGARGTHRGTGDPAGRRLLKKPGRVGAWVGPQRSSKRTLFCSRKLIHHQSQFLRAPTVLFASERGQGRAAFFAARRSKPLTLRSGEYAGEWLCAQQFRAHNHDDKAVIPPSQVGQVYERKAGQFLRASRFLPHFPSSLSDLRSGKPPNFTMRNEKARFRRFSGLFDGFPLVFPTVDAIWPCASSSTPSRPASTPP